LGVRCIQASGSHQPPTYTHTHTHAPGNQHELQPPPTHLHGGNHHPPTYTYTYKSTHTHAHTHTPGAARARGGSGWRSTRVGLRTGTPPPSGRWDRAWAGWGWAHIHTERARVCVCLPRGGGAKARRFMLECRVSVTALLLRHTHLFGWLAAYVQAAQHTHTQHTHACAHIHTHMCTHAHAPSHVPQVILVAQQVGGDAVPVEEVGELGRTDAAYACACVCVVCMRGSLAAAISG
jgi:hypothetical protein